MMTRPELAAREETPGIKIHLVIKRFMDVILGLVALLFLIPLILVVALAIKIDSPGPVIFRQVRIGKNGKTFVCYKFRSMFNNADQSVYTQFIKEVMHNNNDEQKGINHSFRLKNGPADARVTKVGRIIRSMSIDELPQLINVLKGDMSLVGPRPDMPISVDGYTDFERKRLQVLPGMTGLWQVSGRARLTVRQMFELDNQYVDDFSIWLDIKILLKTLPAVIKRDGAS